MRSHVKLSHSQEWSDAKLECGKCHKTFKHPSMLKRHEAAHANERPFPCDQCSNSFKNMHALKKHVRRMHPSNKSDTSSSDPRDGPSAKSKQGRIPHYSEFYCFNGITFYKIPSFPKYYKWPPKNANIIPDRIFLHKFLYFLHMVWSDVKTKK